MAIRFSLRETGFYTTQPHLYAKGKLAYDAEKDFVPRYW